LISVFFQWWSNNAEYSTPLMPPGHSIPSFQHSY